MVKPDQWDVLHNRAGKDLPVRPELAKETLEEKWAKWNRCVDAIGVLRKKLEEMKPDVLVMCRRPAREHSRRRHAAVHDFRGEDFEASVSLSYFKSQVRQSHQVQGRPEARRRTGRQPDGGGL